MDRQAIRIVPTHVSINENKVLLDKVPYDATIKRMGDYFVAETKFFFVLGNAKNERLFKILDKEYKRMPTAVFVALVNDDAVIDVEPLSISDWVVAVMGKRPSNKTMNMIAKAWGELKSRELNPLPGMAFKTDENGNILTNFKEGQIAARFQLFRPTEMPYIVVDLAGFDLVHGTAHILSKTPLQRKDLLIDALKLIQDKYSGKSELYPYLRVVPSGVGTALGDIFSKINILPFECPIYPNVDDDDTKIIARVWKKQEYLGLGKGAMRVRSSLQFKLSHSSLIRTVTVRVGKELFKKYIKARVRIPKLGPIKSFKITNHLDERVSVFELGQRLNDAIDPWFSIPRVDLVYNGAERGYYVKFYIKYNYHAVRTGDKLLSYTNEFFKGVAVVDENIPEGIDIECTWDNIKGFDSQVIEEHDDYVLIKINPASLFIVERGTSNARRLGFYGFRGHDAYEMMILNELFPDLIDNIESDSDPRLKYFIPAMKTFFTFEIVVDKEIDSIRFLLEAENFFQGLKSIFEDEDFEGGYVVIQGRKFPVPGHELIYAMANEYDSGISHSNVVIRYLRMLTYFVANDEVLETNDNPTDYRPNISMYKKVTSRDLYNFFKSPKLLAFSSIKRIVNHMHDVLHNVVAVSDEDFVVKDGVKYGLASVYPSVHPTQVKHKIVKVVSFSMFKKMFKEITGEELPITELHDAVLMNPHLVNNIFLKDNDGDALALRIPTDQELMKSIWEKVNKTFWNDVKVMAYIKNDQEIWEELRPKSPTPLYPLTFPTVLQAMDAGIHGKLMIGMITRQARRVQFGLILLLKKYPQKKVVIKTAIIQIAKAMQDVIDGLKHDRDIEEVVSMYSFLRDIVNLDWATEKERKKIYARFFNSPITRELRPLIPELKRFIDQTIAGLRWLYGDGYDDDYNVVDSYEEFNRYFKRIAKVYLINN